MKNLKNTWNAMNTRLAAAVVVGGTQLRNRLRDKKGDFVMDHAVVAIIVIVLAAAAIILLKKYLNDYLAPAVQEKSTELFGA